MEKSHFKLKVETMSYKYLLFEQLALCALESLVS